MNAKSKIKHAIQLITDYMRKCGDDHVGAFGAMSAFFILLSVFPFMLILLMATKYLPFSKEDIIRIITDFMEFEDRNMIAGIINEIYRKAGFSVLTVTAITAMWGSSRGIYSILLGLNSVNDIDEKRNYVVLRLLSIVYTLIFIILLMLFMLVWVFGKLIFYRLVTYAPWLHDAVISIVNNKMIVSFVVLTIVFMLVYAYIPNLPNKRGRLIKQWPGAMFTTISWLVISEICSMYIKYFSGFSYVYGSLSWIMLLLIWLYWCMSMLFYGAEVNYLIENYNNYHQLIRIIRPRYTLIRRANEKDLKKKSILEHSKNSIYYHPTLNKIGDVDRDMEKYMEQRNRIKEEQEESD